MNTKNIAPFFIFLFACIEIPVDAPVNVDIPEGGINVILNVNVLPDGGLDTDVSLGDACTPLKEYCWKDGLWDVCVTRDGGVELCGNNLDDNCNGRVDEQRCFQPPKLLCDRQ